MSSMEAVPGGAAVVSSLRSGPSSSLKIKGRPVMHSISANNVQTRLVQRCSHDQMRMVRGVMIDHTQRAGSVERRREAPER